MGQFKEIIAWKCAECGRILTTTEGVERHAAHCKFAIPCLEGQVTLEDVAASTKHEFIPFPAGGGDSESGMTAQQI